MDKVIHRSKDRGKGDYSWLTTRYSFSFANWYDANRMGFGALRVINDDLIAPDNGFDQHRHQDMEIITIVMKGTVTHTDSMGNTGVVSAGEVQAMSAGTGVIHAEYNASPVEPLELFQLWIEPNVLGAAPRYSQRSLEYANAEVGLTLLVSPDGQHDSLPIHQNAYLWRGTLGVATATYALMRKGNGVYIFVVEGTLQVGDEKLGRRDAMGIWNVTELSITPVEPSVFLLIEVPLN